MSFFIYCRCKYSLFGLIDILNNNVEDKIEIYSFDSIVDLLEIFKTVESQQRILIFNVSGNRESLAIKYLLEFSNDFEFRPFEVLITGKLVSCCMVSSYFNHRGVHALYVNTQLNIRRLKFLFKQVHHGRNSGNFFEFKTLPLLKKILCWLFFREALS